MGLVLKMNKYIDINNRRKSSGSGKFSQISNGSDKRLMNKFQEKLQPLEGKNDYDQNFTGTSGETPLSIIDSMKSPMSELQPNDRSANFKLRKRTDKKMIRLNS